MAVSDYLTSYSEGDVKVILTGDFDETELYCDIIREAMEHPVRFAPPIEITKIYDKSFIVKTNQLLADFLVNDSYWNGDYKPHMETVCDFKKRSYFKGPRNSLPPYVVETLLAQNQKLESMYNGHPTYAEKGMEGVISHLTGRQLENDAMVFWNSDDKGSANNLQFRSLHLRILVKVAHNNFVSFYGRVTNVPTDETELTTLRKKFEALRDLVFRSIYTKDPHGLIKFYDFIQNEF